MIDRRLVQLTIEKLVYGGDGMGRADNKVIFVPYSAPGDRLKVEITENKKTYSRGSVYQLISSSPLRTEPECKFFGVCGGCHWQHLNYSCQCKYKEGILREFITHSFPGLKDLEIKFVPSLPYAYRNRVRFKVHPAVDGLSIGFHRSNSHELIQIDSCPLLLPRLNEALDKTRQLLSAVRIDLSSLKEIEMVCCQDEEAVLVNFVTEEGQIKPNQLRRLNKLAEGAGIIYCNLNRRRPKACDSRYTVTTSLAGFKFRMHVKAFFQPNIYIAEKLVKTMLGLIDSRLSGLAVDFYSGVGLFSLPLCQRFRKVICVEENPFACDTAVSNFKLNGISNYELKQMRVERWLNGAQRLRGKVELLILDPPRAGASPQALRGILSLKPYSVIYVSCNLAVLMRDLKELAAGGYRIEKVVGLDMFPQTYHFETVVSLVQR